MPRIPIERQPLSMDVSAPVGESRAGLQLGASIANVGESIADAAMTVQQDLQRTMNTIEVEKAKSDFSIRGIEKQYELERQFDEEYARYNSAPVSDAKASEWKKNKIGLITKRYKQWLEEERPKYEASFGTESARLDFVRAYEGMSRGFLEKTHAMDLDKNIKNELADSNTQAQRIANTMTSYSQVYNPNSSNGNEWYRQVTALSTRLNEYVPLWGREKVEAESKNTKALWSDSIIAGKITDAMRGGKKSVTRVEELRSALDILDEKDTASLWAIKTGRVPLGRLMDPNTKERRRREIISMLDSAGAQDHIDLTGRLNDMRAHLATTGDVNNEGITPLVGMVLSDKKLDPYKKANMLGDMWQGAREFVAKQLLSRAPDASMDVLVEQIVTDPRLPSAQSYLSKQDPNYSTVGQADRVAVKNMLTNLKEQMVKDRADDSAGSMAKHIPGMADLAVAAELTRPDQYTRNAVSVKNWIDSVDQQYATYRAPRQITVMENGKKVTKTVTGSAYATGTGEKRYIPKAQLEGIIQLFNSSDTDVANKMATNVKATFGRAASNYFDQLAEAPGSNKLWKSVGAFPADSNIQRLTIKAIQHQKGLIAFAPSAFETAKTAINQNQLFSSYASSSLTDESRHSQDLLNNMKTLIAVRAIEMAGMDNTAGSVEGSMGNISMHVENATREIFDQLFVTFTTGDLYGTHFPKKVMDKYQGAINTTETGLRSFIDNNLKTLEGINGLNITYPSIMQDGKVRPMNEFDKTSFVKQVGSSARLIHSYRADKNGEITHGVMVAYRKRLNDGTQISSYEYLADKEGRRLFIPLDVVMKGIHEVQKYTKSTLFEPRAKGP